MIRKHFLLILILSTTLGVFAQTEEVLITIGDTKVSKGEFERIYKKNNSNLYDNSDKKTPKGYLDLFVNFKLKVIEAQSLKMDTSKAFIDELAGYRKELAAPYLTDVKFEEEMVKELYDRKTKEVEASHILLKVGSNDSAQKETEVLNKIKKIREEIINGLDFNKAASKYSGDPSAKANGGKLGYFTAFQMVVPFENAAFSTPVGEISEPVRSSFGYHLVKVHDLRENRGEIRVAHIMKIFPQGITPAVKSNLKSEINLIYKDLVNGADFTKIAKEKSDDKRSSVQGGEMPWVSAGRMPVEFADASFALKNDGDFSKPVETQFGYHIIKKLEHRPISSFEDSKLDIENKIKRDPARSTSSKMSFIKKLKAEYNYSEMAENVARLKGKDISDNLEDKQQTLFSIDNKNFTILDFENYIQNENIKEGNYSKFYDNWIEYEITKLEDAKLEEKYPAYKYLLREYHDGILLFNISEEKIWNYAVEDSVGLESFYTKNRKAHNWGERFKGLIVTCNNDSVREEAEKYLSSGMEPEEITDLLNKEKEMIVITDGAWERGANEIIDYFIWEGSQPATLDAELTFIRGDKIKPEPKILNEARGLFISDYQNYLEKQWLKELRKKYKIKVNRKLLKSVEGV